MLLRADLSQYEGQYQTLAMQMQKIGEVFMRKQDEDKFVLAETIKENAKFMEDYTHLTYKDINLDAKVFTTIHPYGTGSYDSIENCVGLPKFMHAGMHSVDDSFRKHQTWPFFQHDRKTKLTLYRTNRYLNRNSVNKEEKAKFYAENPRYTLKSGQKPNPQVATKGTKRQRQYYEHEFGSEVRPSLIDSTKYYHSAKQDFVTMCRKEYMGPPNGMLTYVGNDQTADVRTCVNADQGPLGSVDPSDHIRFMFKSSWKKTTRTPVYQNPGIVAVSYMKRRTRFLARACRRGASDSLIGVLEDFIRRLEEQKRKYPHDHMPVWFERCNGNCNRTSRFCFHNPKNSLSNP